jgi:hypothetical protein
MAAMAEHSLTLDLMGKCFKTEFGVVVSLTFTPYLIIFIFEHFPIGANVNLCPVVAAILDFGSAQQFFF